jgi:phage I-like protein
MDAYTVVLDAPDRPRSRIQIAQLGEFKDNRYGEFAIGREDVENWRANLSKLPGGRALIDLDHSADRSPRRTEAAGWITGIDWDGDTPVADVEWTPVGKDAIEQQRYLFFSPTYGPFKDETGTVHDNVLQGGALTNKPFLTSMPALTLASEETLQAASAQLDRENADRLLDALQLKLLGVSADERKLAVKEGNALPDGSYPIRNTAQLHAAAILAASGHGDAAAAQKLIRRRAKELGVALSSLPGFGSEKQSDSRRQMDTEVLTLLDLAEDTDVAGVVDAIKALQAKAEQPETTTLEQQAKAEGKVVLDKGDYDSLKAGAQAGLDAQKELAAQRFESEFQRALEQGRAVPAEKDSFQHFYTLDAEATLKQLADRPQIVHVKPVGGPGRVDEPSSDPHDTFHTRVLEHCEKHNLNPDFDYQKALDQMLGVAA